MIKKGTLVVRTKVVSHDVNMPERALGAIFRTVHDGSTDAFYTQTAAIRPENFRLATPEEEEYFNTHTINNINQILEENEIPRNQNAEPKSIGSSTIRVRRTEQQTSNGVRFIGNATKGECSKTRIEQSAITGEAISLGYYSQKS